MSLCVCVCDVCVCVCITASFPCPHSPHYLNYVCNDLLQRSSNLARPPHARYVVEESVPGFRECRNGKILHPGKQQQLAQIRIPEDSLPLSSPRYHPTLGLLLSFLKTPRMPIRRHKNSTLISFGRHRGICAE